MSRAAYSLRLIYILISTLCSQIGSKPVGILKNSIVDYEEDILNTTLQPTLTPRNPNTITSNNISSDDGFDVVINPCNLILPIPPVAVTSESVNSRSKSSDNGITIVSLEEKEFIRLSHPLFQVHKEIVAGIAYQGEYIVTILISSTLQINVFSLL